MFTSRNLTILFRLILALVVSYATAFGWGSTGHRYINRNAVVHLPSTMNQFIAQQSFFESHAMDADYRKSTDTAEAPKHFIDIDNYPNFRNITRSLDSLIMQYGWTFVRQNGIVPWATVWTLDSLTAQLAQSDWNRAYLTASDLGHYVADAHQPLHCTRNYNGQYTGNNGIHSRYESTMITNFRDSLYIIPDTVFYIGDPINFIFEYVFHSQSLADSVMQADNYAKLKSGWNGSGTPPSSYYTYLWQRSRIYTIDQIQRATVVLASFWYTVWVNAGLLPPPTSVGEHRADIFTDFSLHQNFPNPFNPSTDIRFHLHASGESRGQAGIPDYRWVKLGVYDLLGREIALLVNEMKAPGNYTVTWDTRVSYGQGAITSGVSSKGGYASGVYFYRLTDGSYSSSKKMLLIK